jgi:hypothetical protein
MVPSGCNAGSEGAAGSVIQLAASQYAYTVLDVPRSDLTVLDTLDDVANIVVVANQELATVRNAGRMAAALRARYPGFATERRAAARMGSDDPIVTDLRTVRPMNAAWRGCQSPPADRQE